MNACIDYIENIRSKYSSFLDRVHELAKSGLGKLGVDEDATVYINKICKKNGKCYVYLEVYTWSTRKKIGLGRLEDFDKEKLYSVLRKRFGLTREEVDALFLVKDLREVEYIIQMIEHHLEKTQYYISKLQRIDQNISIDHYVEKVKQPVEATIW